MKNTILVIEDDTALQDAVKIKLKKSGINVLTANTGEEGFKILEVKRPNLIWLDIHLPGINGIEFLKEIRKNKNFENLPVIIVSVSGGPEKIKEAFQLKIIDYIIKSDYSLNDIIQRVKDILNKLK